jgi:hypothetical protein
MMGAQKRQHPHPRQLLWLQTRKSHWNPQRTDSTCWPHKAPHTLRIEPTSSASSPTGNALILTVGAVLAEQHDEWTESRRCLGLDVLSKSRATNDTPTEQQATPAALTA